MDSIKMIILVILANVIVLSIWGWALLLYRLQIFF